MLNPLRSEGEAFRALLYVAGVVIAIAEEFGLPVKLVGVGEKIDDLRDFDPPAFADALFPDPR